MSAQRHINLEWHGDGQVIGSRGRDLYSGRLNNSRLEWIGATPVCVWKKLLGPSKLCRRALRLMYFNVVPITQNRFAVWFDKSIGLIEHGNFTPIMERNRFRVLRQGVAQSDCFFYFGEYFGNPNRDPVNIYRFRTSDTCPKVEVVYTFPAKSVRHVHRIQQDPYSSELWCMTGDLPHECQILKTGDQFDTLHLVGGGDESWRCISPLFTEKSIYYATDSEFDQNAIYRIDRISGERTLISTIDGPVYYSILVGNDLFFAVTAENCPSQSSPHASIWHVHNKDGETEKAKQLVRFKKDILSPKLFLPGTITFPSGPCDKSGVLYFNTFSLRGADFGAFKLSRAASV
jgi:hypothetical protein